MNFIIKITEKVAQELNQANKDIKAKLRDSSNK
jgi:hypothetical protein